MNKPRSRDIETAQQLQLDLDNGTPVQADCTQVFTFSMRNGNRYQVSCCDEGLIASKLPKDKLPPEAFVLVMLDNHTILLE